MADFEIFILAGGKSSRMGEDKGLMSLFGKPMIQYVLEEVKKLDVAISIISNNSAYKKFNFPVYKDIIKDVGPLGGIHSALSRSEKPKIVILSCDTPYVTIELIEKLLNHSDEAKIIIPAFEEQLHPLIGIYHQEALSHIEAEINNSTFKIIEAIKKYDNLVIDANNFDKIVFKNLNSKADVIH